MAAAGASGVSDTYFIGTADDSRNLYATCVDSDGEYIWWGGYADEFNGNPYGWMTVLNLDGTVNASKEISQFSSQIIDGVITATNNGMVTVGNGYLNSTYSSNRAYLDWNNSGGFNAKKRNLTTNTEIATGIGYQGSGNVFYTIGQGNYSGSGYVTFGKVTASSSDFSENESRRFQYFSSYPSGFEPPTYGGIAVDSSGKPIIAGYYLNCARYNTSLSHDVGKTVSLNATEYNSPSLAVDSNDNVILSGYGKANSSSYREALLIKFNQSDFSVAWARALREGSSANAGRSYSCCVDSNDNVYMCGTFGVGYHDYGFIAKYNSSGTLQWSRRFTVSGTTFEASVVLNKIKTDSRDNVLVAGWINNGTDKRALILKIPSDGVSTQTISIDSRTITIADPTLTNTNWSPSTSNYSPTLTNTSSTNMGNWNHTAPNSGYTNTIQEL